MKNTRIFCIKPITNGFRNKIVGYVISDGLNDVEISQYEFFLIESNAPLDEPLIFNVSSYPDV